LSGPDRAVYLCVNLVNADRVPLANKGIKDVLAKLLSFNDDLLANRMDLFIKYGQSVYAIGLFGNSGGD